MTLLDALAGPFIDYAFMRRALAGSVALALAAGPLGVFLVLRRMSLMGDAMAHAILPGVAAGFLLAGFSLTAMILGGLAAGLIVAFAAGLVSRLTPQREDASFASFYLISLALGVLLVSWRGSNMDLLHVLFGTVLALGDPALWLVAIVATVTILALAVIYRPLVLECLDPGYSRRLGHRGGIMHMVFLVLMVLTMVAGFQVLGTLMVVGIMMLPATATRFWAGGLGGQVVLAACLGAVACYIGLLASYYLDVPASSAIILVAGVLYAGSVCFGPRGGLAYRYRGARQTAADLPDHA